MNPTLRNILILAACAHPAQAIEPPVEAQPIPPKKVPEQAPRAVPVPNADEAPKARPIPEVVDERPFIGVILDPVPDLLADHLKLKAGEGLVISELVDGGPAELAGLEINDIITKVDGAAVGTPAQVRREVEAHEVGDEVTLEVIHHGERREVAVALGAAPDMIPGVPNQGFGLGGNADELEGMLGNLPEKHAELMRRALEQGMRGFGQLDEGAMPENWQRDLLRRLEFRGLDGGENFDLPEFRAESSVRLLDDQGSIEMKSVDGQKE
ncbi:MAG: PDZ domain-containing protein, partial [Verrucomicrobiota bacterium]